MAADEIDGSELVYLAEFRSVLESEVVVALLESSGIPTFLADNYDRRINRRILVPRYCLEDAKRLISEAQK